MTHDELLAKVDEEFGIITFDENGKGLCNTLEAKGYYALRAVVELHKPVMAFTGGYDGEENELWAEQCSDCSNNGFSQMYPCLTIQAIEKELS
jgi:hypothetical protein